jgi:hypothetical protein
MSDFNISDLHDCLPHEARLTSDSHDNAVQQLDTMLLDDQPHVVRPLELLDHGVQHDTFFDDAMLLDYQLPLEQPSTLFDDEPQRDFMSDNTMPLDDQPPVEQPSELDGGAQQDSVFSEFMAVDDQPPVEQQPQLYNYGTQDEIVFDPDDFERDMAHIMTDPSGWWAQYGGTLRPDGLIDFASSVNDPAFDFEMGGVPPPIDPAAQAPSAEPTNSFGFCGLPTTFDNTPTNGQLQQSFAQHDYGSSQYPPPPGPRHSLPYDFSWDEITQRQSRVAGGNRHGQFVTNCGTGTVLEAIPEFDARSSGLASSPLKQPSSADKLGFAVGMATPSPSPTLQAATVRKKTTVRRHTVATGRNQPAAKFPIYQGHLLVNGLADAKGMANTRITLEVMGDDDRDLVVSHPEYWVPLIANAFDSDFLVEPDDGTKLTPEGQAEWTRWQREHDNKVWGILNAREGDAPRFVQSCAYIFYDLVLEAHEQGNGLPHVGKTIANPGPNIHLKCSERINNAISVLAKFPIVRYDFLRQDRLDGLAANPLGFVNRKVENMWVNYRKKHNTGPVKEEPAKPVKAKPAITSNGTEATKSNLRGKKRTAAQMEQQFDANGLPTGGMGANTRKKQKPAPRKRASQVKVPSSQVTTPMQVKGEDDGEDEIM